MQHTRLSSLSADLCHFLSENAFIDKSFVACKSEPNLQRSSACRGHIVQVVQVLNMFSRKACAFDSTKRWVPLSGAAGKQCSGHFLLEPPTHVSGPCHIANEIQCERLRALHLSCNSSEKRHQEVQISNAIAEAFFHHDRAQRYFAQQASFTETHVQADLQWFTASSLPRTSGPSVDPTDGLGSSWQQHTCMLFC